QTKAQLLDDLKTGKLQFKKIEPGELQIRVYGATAIINGTAKFSVVSNGEAKDINLRFTDVWVDHAGRWQLVAWQSTKLP
ncbi:MAG TPA: nuclear transport factor 2 family protein, partial [Polyangia bacterium]|nr:nuclear transport factor 2 family protein [Polyangia bacterium]